MIQVVMPKEIRENINKEKVEDRNMTVKKFKEFFKYVGEEDVYGISIKFSPQTLLWIDKRAPCINMLFSKKDFDSFETKYGKIKDEMFIIFDANFMNFEFEDEKRGKLKYLFNME